MTTPKRCSVLSFYFAGVFFYGYYFLRIEVNPQNPQKLEPAKFSCYTVALLWVFTVRNWKKLCHVLWQYIIHDFRFFVSIKILQFTIYQNVILSIDNSEDTITIAICRFIPETNAL